MGNFLKGALIGAAFGTLCASLVYKPGVEIPSEVNMPAIEASVQLGNFCSGTFIKDPITFDGIQPSVLSARHCTKGFYNPEDGYGQVIKISNESGIEQDFEVVLVSTDSDMVILQPVDKNWDDMRIVTADVVEDDVTYQFGTKAWSVGYPGGTGKTMTSGFLGYLETLDVFGTVSKSKLFQKSTTMSIGGSSGQGLFVYDGGYKLMGTLTGGMGGFVNYYTPLNELQDFLDGADAAKAARDAAGTEVVEEIAVA